ncbi:Eukaryotic translation initiation factor 4E type 3 [Orchesella cincta]|uniref:Eukaryotic translation initiation factor 4E type 3 n=1 Tax=Orchesella cincta TaxID=48709 RepID=A0A1D2N9I4_ORCCI|nr:Eukaryotic translation initiation factor 4E type 3 [Orchesella cincta]
MSDLNGGGCSNGTGTIEVERQMDNLTLENSGNNLADLNEGGSSNGTGTNEVDRQMDNLTLENNGNNLADLKKGGSSNGTGTNEVEPRMDELKLETSQNNLADLNGGGSSNGAAIETDSESRKEATNTGIDNPKEFFQGVVGKQKNVYGTNEESLSSPWTFWRSRCLKGSNAIEYNRSLAKIHTCFTTKTFWVVMNNLPEPSKYQVGSSLHIMRDLIKPLWEEPYNAKGGSFRLQVQKKDLDKVWRAIVLAMIGEQFNSFIDTEDEICGISVSTRESEDSITIWNKNADAAPKATLMECHRRLLPDLQFKSFTYKAHEKHPAFGEKSNLCCCCFAAMLNS